MEFFEWLDEFEKILKKRQTSFEKRTFEDYLATFANLPPVPGKSVKCAFVAELLRNEGNDLFKIGNYEDAAIMYTQSIRKAPPYSKCAALAYANRSAASYHLKAYEECVADINKALDLPYPDDLKQKIISRKEAAVSNLNKAKAEKKNTTPIDDLKLAHGGNAKLPGASNGIDIVYNPDTGRKIIANKSFQTGDVLIIEKPFLMVPDIEQDPRYCYHCLKKSLFLIPCDECTYNVYCSEKCRTEAYEKYHRFECSIQPSILRAHTVNTQFVFDILRCLIIFTEQGTNLHEALKDRLKINDCSDPVKLGFTGEQFIGNTKEAFLSFLYGQKLLCTPGSYFEETYITILLRNYTDFFKDNANIPDVAKLLLALKTAYSLNYLPIRQSDSAESIAHGTYPLLHLAGHACYSNTITYLDKDGTIVLRASQNIKPGEDISFNYLMWVINFTEIHNIRGRFRTATSRCLKCHESVSYPVERYATMKIDKKLRGKLKKNPYNIALLWKLLNLANEIQKPNDLHVQVVKMILVEAYEGRRDSMTAQYRLELFGI